MKQHIELNGKTILVTGSPGFIGANLVLRLLTEMSSGTVVSLDNMNDYYDPALKEYRLREIEKAAEHSPVKHVFVKGSIADKALVDEVFSSYQPAVVVNLAAQAGVRYSIDHPDVYIESNLIKAFASALFERMDWIKDYRFQFRGIFRERGNSRIIFFSLDEPRIYSNCKLEKSDSLSETKYIKYTNDGDQEKRENSFDTAYPIEWQKNLGLSCSMRKRRDRIADMITENDICVEGTCAVNPLIGEIPTKEAALEELEALLIEM